MIGVIGSCRYFELSDDGGGVAVSYSPFLMDGGGSLALNCSFNNWGCYLLIYAFFSDMRDHWFINAFNLFIFNWGEGCHWLI